MACNAGINVARCPKHGLHGQREECFICGGPVEQVAMVPVGTVDHYFEAGGPAYEDAIMVVVAVHERMQRGTEEGTSEADGPIRGLSKAEAKRLLPIAVDLATYAIAVMRGDIEANDEP